MNTSEMKAVEMAEFNFIEGFSSKTSAGGVLSILREKALQDYVRLSFPHDKTRGWRKVSLEGLDPQQFNLSEKTCVSSNLISDDERVMSEIVTEHARLIPKHVLQKIGTIVSPQSGKFAAFAHAFSRGTAVIYIPEGVQVTQPIIFQQNYCGENQAVPENTLVYLARNASASIVRKRESQKSSILFMGGATEIYLEENAHLNFIEIQDVNQKTWDIQSERANLEQSANLNWFTLTQGSSFSRSQLVVDLTGKGSEAHIAGLFLPRGDQRFYFDTAQNHMATDTVSDLLYHGVIDGDSRSIWQGMVSIAEQAARSNGYQANRNIILSERAKIDSIPGLEILTDDVRCSHAVTITNLDWEQLFYLKSRGLEEETAKDLIVSGFIAQVLDRVPSDEIRELIKYEFISKINKDVL
ncbi:MAG: sufD [Anaerolinea thermophila]|uniref:SufD n=1 Tax=Anaerolinea thermophila TaxID=167964 RepID=A0A101FZ81_9CHLR|nr:MAG: sufD [Anaerolinea thermophila]